MAYIKVKGKTYGIHTGSRGGKYWVDDSGKKHYLKSTKEGASKKEDVSKKPKEVPKLRRWIGRFSEDIGDDHDTFSEWCEAYTKKEAEEEFRNRYRHNDKIELDYVYEE